MKNKINIAEILKDCPKGTKLYSPLSGECKLERIHNELKKIIVSTSDGMAFSFYSDGKYFQIDNSECLLFPSKDNKDWSTFQRPFNDGDILTYTGHYTTTFIYRNKEKDPNYSTSFYVACNDAPSHNFLIYNKYALIALNENCDVRLATEDEKQKLFEIIKANGYKWNEETKSLEKLPKFKVGDRIVKKGGIQVPFLITGVSDAYYSSKTDKYVEILPVVDQDDWELFTNKFDTNTLKPFESRVLVRDYDHQCWGVSFFGYFDKFMGKFDTVRGVYIQCIPYEGNEHLLNTNKDCDEYYKNW